MDYLALRLSKTFVQDSLMGAGAIQGKSAYEIALENGYSGSQKAWLASLRGSVPTIGDNGNWFLDGKDTNVIASPSLAGYATENFVESIFQSLDLSKYATVEELSKAVGEIVLPDVSGFITQKEIDQAIANIPKTDLSSYVTKEELSKAIGAIEIPVVDLSEYATMEYVQNLIESLEMPEGIAGMVALSTEEILAICKQKGEYMANDLKKFLDQEGVGTLWSRVTEEIEKKNAELAATTQLAEENASNIKTMQVQIEALEEGTYDDTELRSLIAAAQTKANSNASSIELFNKDANTSGSIRNIATTIAAAEVAKVVANADSDFDTLKEIADWILNDTTGAADMANDIAALQALVGDNSVATQITTAIDSALKIEGVDKYALATELTELANRVKALEDAGYMNSTAVNAAIDTKIAALKLSDTYEAKGAANTALINAKAYSDGNLLTAKSYTDSTFANIVALTEAEIDAAIAAAK